MAISGGRVSLALAAGLLDWSPTWTNIDAHPNLVASFTIDRGRQYELDQTDAARATVEIIDPEGILDPRNPSGPHFGFLEPLVQCRLRSWDPMEGAWEPRFRGWVTDWDYVYEPSQQMQGRLLLQLTDIFEVLGGVQMLPGRYGTTPPADSTGQVYFPLAHMDDRINDVLDTAIGATAAGNWTVVFSGNVWVRDAVYSPGESVLEPIVDAANAEFPGVSNVYTDRRGRLAVHGRLAKFDPAGVLAGAPAGAWDWHQWEAGDHAAVVADLGDVVQLRRFAWNRGVSKIINSALATPFGIADADVASQVVADTTSIGLYGERSWSAQNLLTLEGLLDSSTDLQETKRFATFYVDNYKQPRDRVTNVEFRSIRPGADGSAITWKLLTRVDVSDQVNVTVTAPAGGAFTSEPYYVEGVHETVRPLNPDYDDITVTLDLSPKAYYDTNPFPIPAP